MTKSRMIQIIRFYTEEHLCPYDSFRRRDVFEERAYMRSGAVDLAEFVMSSDSPRPQYAVMKWTNMMANFQEKSKHPDQKKVFECSVRVGQDILEIFRAMGQEEV